MCFDSLNSSDIACGEYASRTLAGKQAPALANTPASASQQAAQLSPGLLRMLSATAAKSISEVKPSNKRGAHQKHRFWIPLGNKTGKKWSRCFRTGTNQRVLRRAIPAGGS